MFLGFSYSLYNDTDQYLYPYHTYVGLNISWTQIAQIMGYIAIFDHMNNPIFSNLC